MKITLKAIRAVLNEIATFDRADMYWSEFVKHPDLSHLENTAITNLQEARAVTRKYPDDAQYIQYLDMEMYELKFKTAMRLAILAYIKRQGAHNDAVQTAKTASERPRSRD